MSLCENCKHIRKDWEVGVNENRPHEFRTWVICELNKDGFPWKKKCESFERKDMKYSNCLIWAFAQFIKRGGYISFRRGVHFGGFYIHFLWAEKLSGPWYSYHCKGEKRFPWPLFRGEVIKGDPWRDEDKTS